MASPESEKARVSTTEYSRDPEQGVISTTEGRAHRSGIADPGPLGLFSFASTTFIVSLYTVQARGITHPNVIVGMGLFTGGLTQILVAMWQFPRGNVFGATVFASYGAFWLSYATIYIPSSGILAAYTDPTELSNALGIYLLYPMILSLFFLLNVIRSNLAYSMILTAASLSFGCLAAAELSQSAEVTKAGGVFGIIAALVAYYVGVSEMLAAEERPIVALPLGVWR
ncbi:Ammonia transport outward protein 2 [Mycena sanguinolenta]|uniref:Ammonia transport outward protein 2 n=1 Tax=Mycena sanguinolenta TaxID=230812 RepID=A0A8H6XPP2_9AGAR|nr:Ammonia transport outward protein 2 [Mycena sanguinolenta]